MDRTHTPSPMSPETEEQILERIVDAMLGVQDDLQQADDAQWSRILREACQREKAGGQTNTPDLAHAQPAWPSIDNRVSCTCKPTIAGSSVGRSRRPRRYRVDEAHHASLDLG